MNISIIKMGEEQIEDINKPNQPFLINGKIIPKYDGEKWVFHEEVFSEAYEKCYSNDDIDYREYIEDTEKVVFMCYCDSECIGQIRLRKNWNKYCFIEDIAVCSYFRGKGIGKLLIQTAENWAKSNDMFGFMLETQDYNISACRFYDRYGFRIGSVDTMLYSNLDNNEEKAVFWYLKF